MRRPRPPPSPPFRCLPPRPPSPPLRLAYMANSGAGPPASPGAFLQLCTAESQNAFLKAVSEGAQAITRRLLENQQATAAEYGSAAATLHRFRRAADEAVAEAMRREIGTLLDKKKAAFMTMERDHALEDRRW